MVCWGRVCPKIGRKLTLKLPDQTDPEIARSSRVRSLGRVRNGSGPGPDQVRTESGVPGDQYGLRLIDLIKGGGLRRAPASDGGSVLTGASWLKIRRDPYANLRNWDPRDKVSNVPGSPWHLYRWAVDVTKPY